MDEEDAKDEKQDEEEKQSKLQLAVVAQESALVAKKSEFAEANSS